MIRKIWYDQLETRIMGYLAINDVSIAIEGVVWMGVGRDVRAKLAQSREVGNS